MKLLPCPFCGREYTGPNITMEKEAVPFECPRCGAKGPLFGGIKQKKNQPQKYYDDIVIKSWNRRSK